MKEAKLISLAKNGEKSALESLYNASFGSLYKFIRFKVGTSEIAEDICAEAFTRAFENLGKFKGKCSFKTYVYAIAKNLLTVHYTEQKSKFSLRGLEDKMKAKSEISQLEKEEKLDEDIRELNKVFGKLSEKEKLVLELRHLSNFSVRETAEALNMSETNVKVVSHRALEKARKFFRT